MFTIPGTVGYFQSIGYPGFFAYLVIAGEIGGGLALILGVWTRPIALLLLPIMIGATLQHVGNGWLFTNQGGGWEFPVFWTVALVGQALLGDGAFALRLSRANDAVRTIQRRVRALDRTNRNQRTMPEDVMTLPSLFLSHGAPTLPLTDTPARAFLQRARAHARTAESHSRGLGALGDGDAGSECGRA